ncbi:MAG: hypothetical protein E7Z63_01125 [Thermoplasmata archaeon]|nr:hypothetical protein [Thermoplasmata archaeon]
MIGRTASANKKNRTVSKKHLNDLVTQVAGRYGYVEASAEFVDDMDFKVNWTRGPDWIHFNVSDYLDRAPDEVLVDVFDTVFRKIAGDEDAQISRVVGYSHSPGILADNRKDYYKRDSRTLLNDRERLFDSLGRLRAMGVIPEDLDVDVCWKFLPYSKAGECSYLHDIVMVNERLGSAPDPVLDYVIWAKVAHLIDGYIPEPGAYPSILKNYALSASVAKWLDDHGFNTEEW